MPWSAQGISIFQGRGMNLPMQLRWAFLILFLGASQAAGGTCQQALELVGVKEVRHKKGGFLQEASGLTFFQGYLWAVGDKEDKTLYRLDPTAAESTITALDVPLVLRPASWDLLKGCTGAKKGRLDLEGIAVSPEGRFLLLSERYRAVLVADLEDPSGPSPRAIVREIQCIPGQNVSSNDGLEGLTVLGEGYLALEEGKGHPAKRIYHCRLSNGRCASLKAITVEDRTPDLISLDPSGTRLLLLRTGIAVQQLLEVRLGDAAPPACLLDLNRVRREARSRQDLPASFRWEGGVNYEGIAFDPKTATLYLINDNNAAWNRITAGDPEREPTLLYLLKFKRTP